VTILPLYPEPHAQTAGRVIDGEAVLILADAGEVTILNEVGSRIFSLCDRQHSVADIVRIVADEYAISDAEAERDVTEFLSQLDQQAIVTLVQRAN
jgi:hypothetical protein